MAPLEAIRDAQLAALTPTNVEANAETVANTPSEDSFSDSDDHITLGGQS
mgnify:FL=1